MRIRRLVAVGMFVALAATALGATDYAGSLGATGAYGAESAHPHLELALSSQAVFAAEAEIQLGKELQVPPERGRALEAARIALVRLAGVENPLRTPRRHKAASRLATSPARSPPGVPAAVITIA